MASTESTAASAAVEADPSVIVGAACRVPGATNTHALWNMLEVRKDVQRKMPADRYNADAFYHPNGANKGTSNARLGYYLDQGLDQFDASFFNISGKEAEAMDPQQRLLLEVVYEALENAGITLDEIRGTRTSVFAGSFTYDYQSMTNRDLTQYPKYTVTGTDANAILANRISFFFDLHGPSIQVDTACSSSLTAFHLGAQSIQAGESDMAIICGTALHFDPTIFITMSEFGMLSTDGRCRHFDVNGSGYVRGDGICAVILKRQRAAETHGHNIRAIIKGTGANHDGTKEGITLPNNKAQASLVRGIYEAAGMDPKDTGYFEAHGTGTQAGDPREALSIGDVFAAGRTEPLYVGSIKTNIGHLEGASGLAGVIKSMMCVEKAKILPNMHFNTPNPKIDFDGLKIRVPQEVIDWTPENGIRRASINSFGFGGANAHVVIENYIKPQRQLLLTPPDSPQSNPVESPRPFLLPLSSHSENGGKILQDSLAAYMRSPKNAIRDLVYSYSTRRSMHQFRSYAIGSTIKELSEATETLGPLAKWKRADVSTRLGFIFTGQGAQWYAMGRQLIEESKLFRQILQDCEYILQTLPDCPSWSLIDELTKSETDSRLSQSEFSQPLCTALQIALVDLLKTWGIIPSAVAGHSSGEIAAAYAAGILSRRDTIICAYYRGLYMSKGRNCTPGGMMAVGLTEAEANIELAGYSGRAGIAAINSPSSITLSGDKDAILEIKKTLDERKVFARLLQVEQAFHSHHMLPLAPAFQQALATTEGFSPNLAKTPMFSSVTARDSAARPMDGAYWSDNMTGRVRFSDAVTGMVLDGNDEAVVDAIVEIGPHAALKGPTKQTLKTLDLDLPYVASLDRKLGAYDSLVACAGQLFALGYNVDLVAVNSDHSLSANGDIHVTTTGSLLDSLPTYAWDHKSYWAETRSGKEYRQRPYRHSILGAPVPGSPSTNPRWHNYIRSTELTWLKAHSVDGSVLLPAAAFFTIAIEALVRTVPTNKTNDIILSDVSIKAALAIPETEGGVEIMVDLSLLDAEEKAQEIYGFTVYSFTESGETVRNCSGKISASLSTDSATSQSFKELQKQMIYQKPVEKFYRHLNQLGLQYGDAFQLVEGAFESGNGLAIAPLRFDPTRIITGDAEVDSCILHPTFLDSTFHVILAALESKIGRALDDAFVPTFCGSLRIAASMIMRRHDYNVKDYWVSAKTEVTNQRLNSSSVSIHDADSITRLVELQDLQLTALGLSNEKSVDSTFFRVKWQTAFDFLGMNTEEPRFAGLDELLDCYKHQYPANSIIYIQSASDIEDKGQFDLVVFETESLDDIETCIKPGGAVISTDPKFVSDSLQRRFTQDDLTIWHAAPSGMLNNLTLLVASNISKETENLIQQLDESKLWQNVSVKTLESLENLDEISNDQLVSLIALDDNIFVLKDTKSCNQFENLRLVLSKENINLVWLQKSITKEASSVPYQSMMTNLARVARSENETLRLATMELTRDYGVQHLVDSIYYSLNSLLNEDELAVDDGCLMIPRIEADDHLNTQSSGNKVDLSFSDHRLRLIKSPLNANSDSIVFEEDDIAKSLANDEIEVAVRTSSLLRQDEAITFCVGTVMDIGSVTEFQKDDQVFVLVPNSDAHASVIRTKAHMAFALNPKMLARVVSQDRDSGFVSLVPLLKATYALSHVARIQSGDFCVVHDATTPIGQAAISLIQSIGGQVIASVRSESDRSLVAQHFNISPKSIVVVSDGLDELLSKAKSWRVFLNCSSTSYSLPISSGHFVEFDSEFPKPVGNLTYTNIDLTSLVNQDVELVRKFLLQSFELLESTNQLPYSRLQLPYSQIVEAVQSLKSDNSLDQVMLYSNGQAVPVQTKQGGLTSLFHTSKTYLVVGSFGDALLSLAQWMFRKGARKFAFLDDRISNDAIEWLQYRGASVSVETDNDITAQWIESIPGELGGIFHGTAFSGSTSIADTTAEAWRNNIDPAIQATLNLHNATSSRSLDFFLCISSIVSIIGLPSELNYAVANGFLNDFALWRRKQGLPAATINIGLVEGGLVSETENIGTALTGVGAQTLNEDAYFFQLEQGILSQYSDGESDGTVDHQILSGIGLLSSEILSSKSLFRGLLAAASSVGSNGSEETKDLASRLREATNAETRGEILAHDFVDKISAALSIPSTDIHIGLPLSSYGMDSLAAVDFRKWFSQEVGVNLALFEILGSGTIKVILQKVCDTFMTQEADKPKSAQQNQKKATLKAKDPSADLVLATSRPDHIPLSSFQTRQWFMDTVMEQDGGLTCGWTLTLQGKPNLDNINKAFHEVARRNEIFRTRYFEGDDLAEQQVMSTVPANVEYVDMSNASSSIVQDQVYDLIGKAMDLEKGEVYRSRLVKTGNEQYAWIFATHHITVDGASRQSFMEQIVACYNDASTGSDSSATVPKLSYIDFTLWHEGYLKSEQVQSDIEWWKQRLMGASPAGKLLPFAQQETRPEKASHERRVIRSKINKTTLKRMKRICSSVNVTPFHFILTALRSFIFRYTAEEDFTLLVINGERPHPAFEGIIGFFVNVIPLLWKGNFEESFDLLLSEAKKLTMEAMAHSQAPFDSIVDALDLTHNPSHFPLGQIALNYQMYAKSPNYTTTDFEIQDVHVTDVPTACELQFEVLEDPKTGLGFTLDYDSYLYGAPEMDRFMENFMVFIESAVHDFRQPVEELEMCGPQEIGFLRDVCWVEGQSTLDWMNRPLWDRWTDVVQQQPQAIAIKTSDDQSITFEALNQRAIDIAALLQASGIREGDRIGVLSNPSIDVMAAMLSLALIRCAYIPLDPTAAQGRLEYMIENTSAPLVLYGDDLEPLITNLSTSTAAKFLSLSTPLPPNAAFVPSEEAGQPDDVFYIVFTSGSTGKPKGVMVTHENTRTMLSGRQQAHDLSKKDIFIQQSSTSFDISMAQTWGSLVSGATMALATKDTRQDVEELASFIRDAKATMIYMTPTQLAMMVENCSEALQQCSSLRAISLIGEHLPPRLVATVYDLGISGLVVYNEYGPSESTSQNTLYKVPYPKPGQSSVDIGRPLPNSSTYVLNSKARPVPAGVTGELCVGGPQVSLGYLGRPSPPFLKNEFVSGVFKTRGWDRLYRTGDMARFRLDGLIDLKGRISGDKQVKLRGHRIDLEEIETEIHRISTQDTHLPLVTGVVVLARVLEQQTATADMTDDRQLVAFVVTKTKQSKSEYQVMASRLHAELGKTLNHYMMPACLQPLDVLPTTVSGKINRVELIAMTLDPVFHNTETESKSVIEEEVIETVQAEGPGPVDIIKNLFSSILKLPAQKTVLDGDNFFELGGQSVLALRLQKALKKDLSVPVKLVDIFRNPTPAGLANRLGFEATTAATPKLQPTAGSSAPKPIPTPVIELDWDKEAALPNDKRYWPGGEVKADYSLVRQTDGKEPKSNKGTLLIGADGYIGYYMLKYLLILQRDTKVYLLSLGERFNLGDLFAAFMEHQMFDQHLSQTDLLSRTEIVQGHMGKAHFGLDDDSFSKLGQSVQSIYHTGGFVSLLATYQDLYERNVQSVLDMTELASLGFASLHYISTWSIVHVQTWQNTTLATEDNVWLDERSVASFRPPATNDHGYFKSRWVSEMLMEEAARRGFATTIYRCPAHTAPTASAAATPIDNFTINMYTTMAQTGFILKTPERADGLESDVGMIPINYLADTLVRLADTDDVRSIKKEALRLHITNPNSLPYSKVGEVIAKVRDNHSPGQMMDLDQWFEATTAVTNERIGLELSMYKEYLDKGHIMFTINDDKTRPLLEKISGGVGRVQCDAVDAEYFLHLLRQEKGRRA